jgi:hypothetical protein
VALAVIDAAEDSGMQQGASERLRDTKVDVKVALSGLWIAMLFVFAYVDIFMFFRADVIQGALAGRVSGPGFEIGQTFLALTTLYIIVPSLMVAVSLLAPAAPNRIANIVVRLVYAVTVVLSAIGETWIYSLLGSAVEVLLLLAIAWIAWTWPKGAAGPRRQPV